VRRCLAALLALVFAAQSAVAAAHCMRLAAPPATLEVVLCTAEGEHLLHLPLGDAPAHAHGGFCAACGALPAAPSPGTPALAGPLAWYPAEPPLPAPRAAAPFAARGPPYPPHAPPVLA
jgi:hypothetical protein